MRAQLPQYVEAAKARQHQVQNDEFMFARKRALQPARAVVNRFERETITAKALGEKSTQLNVIFDDKKSLHFPHQLRRY